MYYFDVDDGDRLYDQVGAEFESDAAAKQEALLRALDESGYQLARYRGKSKLIIRSHSGTDIHTVPILGRTDR